MLERTVGQNDAYYRSFVERCKDSWKADASAGVAIIEAFRDDVAAGYLRRLRDLVVASVLDDFLGMAEHLIDQGYKDPAASMIGAGAGGRFAQGRRQREHLLHQRRRTRRSEPQVL